MPRILIDVDDVLANFRHKFFDDANRILGRHVEDEGGWDVFTQLTDTVEHEAMRTHMSMPGFCSSLKPFRDAEWAMNQLYAIGEVYAVTAPYKTSATWANERERWLIEHFSLPREMIVHTEAKHVVKGDAFADDKPSNVAAWAKEWPEGLAILVTSDGNESADVPLGCTRARGLVHMVQLIEDRFGGEFG